MDWTLSLRMEDENHPLLFDVRMRDLWYILSETQLWKSTRTVLSIRNTNIHPRLFMFDHICTCEHLYYYGIWSSFVKLPEENTVALVFIDFLYDKNLLYCIHIETNVLCLNVSS